MKNHIFSIGLLATLAISCSIHEMDFKDSNAFEEFYASIENTDAPGTKVYATEELYLRWNADDRITIFNKYTYNQEYRFTGETGDNSGSFKRVDNGDFVTGNSLDNIYAIYPYLESTRISDTGIITVALPAEQKYAENTMGLGANTMISATTDNQLLFKNVGGYLMLKLYGDDVTVSSITLKGNNGERIAGKATVSMPINGVPTVAMSESAEQEITLVCETPVKLGSTAETATTFWIVVPPTVFSKGFTLTVKDNKNGIFEKVTSKSFEIGRNKLARMSALEVSPELPDEYIVFADDVVKTACIEKYDTNGDGEISFKEATIVTSIDGLFDQYRYIQSFDEFQYFISVNSIPARCFARMTRLKSITLPKSITSIGDYAFTECSKLSSFILPNNVTSIGAQAFVKCSSLELFEFEEGSHLDVLSGISQYDIDGNYCGGQIGLFGYCSSLTRITIPASVNSFGYRVFHECGSLKEIVFEKGSALTTIPGSPYYDSFGYTIGAFANCSALERVVLPEKVTVIGDRAFLNCSSLTEILNLENVQSVASSSFAGCSSLSGSFVLPNCKSIGNEAFSNCDKINSIILSENCTSVGDSAFAGCKSITSVSLSNCTSVGQYAFKSCESLQSAVLSIGQMTLKKGTFYGCSSLKSILLPTFLISIEDYAFYGCSNLSEIIIPEDVDYIGSWAFSKTGITSLAFPEGYNTIPEGLFSECFSLTSVTIPSSVETIGDFAFMSCSNLMSITCNTISPPKGGKQMFDTTNNCPIYVPAESVDGYKAAQYWSDYEDRIRPLPVAVDLGLSVKWASFNLGATKPEEYGDYYAWGETEPYYSSLDPIRWKEGKESGYSWASYQWSMGDQWTMTKYCSKSEYGYNGFIDSKISLDPEDDAAHVNLSRKWRTPTDSEWAELRSNCTWTWTTQNGVNGRLVTASNGNSIFLPAAGYRDETELNLVGYRGVYWSSDIRTSIPCVAWTVRFDSLYLLESYDGRNLGFSIRPVYAE